MKLKIPFSDTTLVLGKKAVEAAKQSLMYGVYKNFMGSGARVNVDLLYKLYNRLVDVKQSVKKIQNATAKSGYLFEDINDPEKEPNQSDVKIIEEFINNEAMPFDIWKKTWVRDRHTAGNYYGHMEKAKSGAYLKFNPVDPRTMTVLSDKYGNIQKYIQRVMGVDSVMFDPEEIVHSKMDLSTSNPLLGVSPIEAIALEGQTEIEAQKSNFSFYENNAVPSHLLIVEQELNEDQYKTLKDELDDKFKGADNRFKSGIIPFIKDIKTITPSQKDMQYLETRWFTTKKIVVAFGVDSFILGYTEGVQRGNAEVIYKGFYENTIRPLEIELEDMLNSKILPLLGVTDTKVRIKQSNYDNKKELADITRADVQFAIMTVNEARKERGLEPSDNELADELLFNGLILDDLGQEVTEIKDAVAKKMAKNNEKLYNLLDNDAI